MSLRTRLLVGLIVVASIGLIVADVVTYASLRSFLNERVLHQLQSARLPAASALFEGRRPGPLRGPPPSAGTYPSGTYAQVRRPDGTTLAEVWLGDPDPDDPTQARDRPDIPARLPSGEELIIFDSPDGDHRVWAERLPGGNTFLVAVPLAETKQTLGRLFAIMLAVGLGVLATLGGLAWWVVRIGLRPLERMEETAAEIAAGDLSRRVEPAEPATEVGRLGLALNSMLAQIEEAFAEKAASEEKLRRFLADASHELRTPLTSIRGYAELFRRGAEGRPDDLAKSMRRIEDEAGRMGLLVEDLLLLARLDEGRPLDRTPVDLTALAADAVADARAVDPDRTIELTAAAPVVVEGDEAALRQVMSNLLSNAITHTPDGTPVEVSVGAGPASAVVTVADHGPGLGPDEASRVFERFYRSDPSRARESGGTGLGLSIVAAIVKAHGGTVGVGPTPAGGATFKVTLPRPEPS